MAVHGIARATLDVDVLVVDRAVCDDHFWQDWVGPEKPEIRRGDADDPLAGVVRVTRGDEVVDIIAGKHAWQADMLQRCVQVTLEGRSLPAVDRTDLILLKLFAGGPQDLLDVRLLLAADAGELRREVERRISGLPVSVQSTWWSLPR